MFTSALLLRLHAVRRNLCLPSEVATRERYDLLVLDDRSIAITANAPFSAWDQGFPDKAAHASLRRAEVRGAGSLGMLLLALADESGVMA